MTTLHDTRPCTPSQHSAYRGYDATVGKASLYTGRVYACDCGKQFFTREDRDLHQRRQHCGDAA